MNSASTFMWFRRTALVAISIVLLAAAWYYSAPEPAFRQPESPWVPMAFSPDGLILAAADSTGHKRWWTHTPGGPIHLLRAADLVPIGPPVETPTVNIEKEKYYSPIEAVEFSPNGDLRGT